MKDFVHYALATSAETVSYWMIDNNFVILLQRFFDMSDPLFDFPIYFVSTNLASVELNHFVLV